MIVELVADKATQDVAERRREERQVLQALRVEVTRELQRIDVDLLVGHVDRNPGALEHVEHLIEMFQEPLAALRNDVAVVDEIPRQIQEKDKLLILGRREIAPPLLFLHDHDSP